MDEHTVSTAKQRFGHRLRELRHATGISQEELAHRAGLDRTYISSCERGFRNISLENIYRLAVALEVEPAELLRTPDLYAEKARTAR